MGERSEKGTVTGDSADDDDVLAMSDLVVRHKNPVFGSGNFLEMMGVKVMLASLDVDLHLAKRDYSSPPHPPVLIVFASLDATHPVCPMVFKSLR